MHLRQFTIADSTIFPGTVREVWVATPLRRDGASDSPLALMVFNDGHAYVDPDGWFKTTEVIQSLIEARTIPPIVAVFVDPGHDPARGELDVAWNASNRSFEYDTLSSQYASFLEQDLVPRLAAEVSITDDPDQRAIAGFSSGGICAFTAAWERPDLFGKVMSHSGSFANIRGGHVYPYLVRQSARKPIRVFLQCGTNDVNNEIGNWHLCNQQMASALAFRGYDVRLVSDDGAHDGLNAGAILRDSLAWLWRT